MFQATILIAEDEERLRKIIVKYLKTEGYQVVEAENGQEALDLFNDTTIDLVILDVMMPILDGYMVCKHIRKESNTPIIMLTARAEEEDTLFGFKLGADDYIAKPFRTKELLARIKALLIRSGKVSVKDEIEIGTMKIQLAARKVEILQEEVFLSPKEYDMLLFFIENQGRVLTRDQILNRIWGVDYYGDDRSVDTIVKRLRKKLLGEGDLIATVRGVGYRFEVSHS